MSVLAGPKDKAPRIVDVRAGNLEIRLAETPEEVDAALALRYRVFYDEMAAKPSPEMAAKKRDFDRFDDACDHLLVLDLSRGDGAEAVIGTYRLIRREIALRLGGFYSADEYDVSALVDYPGEILELGRSCIDAQHRNNSTMTMLWRGLAAYVVGYNIDIMFGCASLPGTDPASMAPALSYLYHNHLAPETLRPRALAHRYVDMNLLPPEATDRRAALALLPPLIKGYLRLGAFIGDGAVIDHQFNTVDVCIVVKTELVTGKYFRHYIREVGAERDSVPLQS
jgi:L-ornithine Nalpha-acyltransferase